MKKIKILSILLLVFFTASSSIYAQQKASEEVCYNPNLVKDTSKKSIKSTAFLVMGEDSIKIKYHSPGVRKRIIWGGLVPLDEVWVTGAHDATTLEIGTPFTIAGKNIQAGKYAFFTIPGEKEWTIIINKNWHQHLASEYDEKEDVVRMQVKPITIDHTERLQYFLEKKSNQKIIMAVAWEKLKIEFPIEL